MLESLPARTLDAGISSSRSRVNHLHHTHKDIKEGQVAQALQHCMGLADKEQGQQAWLTCWDLDICAALQVHLDCCPLHSISEGNPARNLHLSTDWTKPVTAHARSYSLWCYSCTGVSM